MTSISGMDVFTAFASRPEAGFAEPLAPEPMGTLAAWLDDARAQRSSPNPDAMVLATVDSAGEPTSRVVLCKQMAVQDGYLVFYTNYDSRKADDLARSPSAAATFHWDHAGRQARVRGVVVRSPKQESDDYFASRPILSQLGAWASRQSEPMRTREELIAQITEVMNRFGIDLEQVVRAAQGDGGGEKVFAIPRPPNWGGYRLWIRSVELWVGGPGRLHERVQWVRELGIVPGAPAGGGLRRVWDAETCAMITGEWRSARLQP